MGGRWAGGHGLHTAEDLGNLWAFQAHGERLVWVSRAGESGHFEALGGLRRGCSAWDGLYLAVVRPRQENQAEGGAGSGLTSAGACLVSEAQHLGNSHILANNSRPRHCSRFYMLLVHLVLLRTCDLGTGDETKEQKT